MFERIPPPAIENFGLLLLLVYACWQVGWPWSLCTAIVAAVMIATAVAFEPPSQLSLLEAERLLALASQPEKGRVNAPNIYDGAPVLEVSNLWRSMQFYVRVLGCFVVEESETEVSLGHADHSLSRILVLTNPGEIAPTVIEHLSGGIDATFDRMMGMGVTVKEPLHRVGDDLLRFAIEDPDGHVLGFNEITFDWRRN